MQTRGPGGMNREDVNWNNWPHAFSYAGDTQMETSGNMEQA